MGDDIPKRIEHHVGAGFAFCSDLNRIFARWQGHDLLMAICERE
jgi:hypothetical protein